MMSFSSAVRYPAQGYYIQRWPELLPLIPWRSDVRPLGKTRKSRIWKVGEGAKIRKHGTDTIGPSLLRLDQPLRGL